MNIGNLIDNDYNFEDINQKLISHTDNNVYTSNLEVNSKSNQIINIYNANELNNQKQMNIRNELEEINKLLSNNDDNDKEKLVNNNLFNEKYENNNINISNSNIDRIINNQGDENYEKNIESLIFE